MRRSIIALAAPLALLTAAPSRAAPADSDVGYGRNLISVATPGRTSKFAPTGDCTVWINAEGLGVGPAQLGGLHGVAMHINVRPLPGEQAVAFPEALASVKAAYPSAPAWLFATVEKRRAAIEAGCAQDHSDPFKVASIGAADRGGK